MGLINAKSVYRQVCIDECQKIIERDINKMGRNRKVNPRRFFAASGMHMKFDGAAAVSSTEVIQEKLEATEINYVLKGEPATLDHLCDIMIYHHDISSLKLKSQYKL